MFEIFQQDQGLVQRLKELKAYYKEKDEVLKEFIQEDEGIGCIQQ